jgi:hypothetical protein
VSTGARRRSYIIAVVLPVLRCAVLPAILVVSAAAAALAGQGDSSRSANPLAELNEQLKGALAAASIPFTADQERAISLMTEERRRASEELFGDLMDFSDGPTRGENADRLRSAIEWMRGEFLKRLTDYLTPEQAVVWQAFQEEQAGQATEFAVASAPPPPAQTQFVRINNNALTAEWMNFNAGGGGTDVIQRGGIGTWHGNAQLLLKDDALNARNAFASNKPSYQEREINVDVSGPVIPGRLTSTFIFNQNEVENVDTVNATLPNGVFALGITKPFRWRQIATRAVLQEAGSHTLRVYVGYNNEVARNQGIGGFTLPERASRSDWHAWNTELTQFSTLSARMILEGRLQMNRNEGVNTPVTDAQRINVLDAFSAGGAQNAGVDNQHNYNFSSRLTRAGEKLTVKTGVEGAYRSKRSSSTSNFGGTFTFSSLADYLAGTPLTYRVTRGNPLVETTQLELSPYVQADLALTQQVTLLAGLRYDTQTNLDDRNNLAPRVAIAYSPGQATVLRGGGGLYYQRLNFGMVENQRRFDGTRQYEIVIDNPSYPDPFAGGTIRESLTSVRVTDPGLEATRLAIGMLSLERTFFSRLIVTATYDYQHEYGRLRTRNLNAPFDSTAPVRRSCSDATPEDACVRPDSSRGNIINLESTGHEVRHNLRVNVRQRFSIFNVSGDYRLERAMGDVQGGAGTALTDNYDLRADWGRAPFPLHSFNSTVNARLPLGVFLAGTMRGNSGRYYTITTGVDNNRDSNVTDRPAGVRPSSLRGPRYLNVDFNLSKAFFLRGSSGSNANVFVNLTNAFNHVHYGTPSGVLTSPNFGRSTSASNPRQIEMGFRFQF